MALPVYTTIARVKEIAMQSARGDVTKLQDYIAAASRLVDRMCGVSDGFFGLAPARPTLRRFMGHNTRRLRVDRYIPNSIEFVEYARLDCFVPEYDEIVDEKGQHWLIAEGCEVFRNTTIEVTARWGYEETPEEIEQVAIEMTLLLFRQRDPALTKIQIDVNSGSLIKPEDITPRTRAICAEYKARRPHVVL